MKPAVLLALSLVSGVFALDFVLLTKQDVKTFEMSAKSIEDAFRERNLSPIASFGPSILSRYSALLLQSESWAKKQRNSYSRLDSLVAYAIVRRHVDSVSLECKKAPLIQDLSAIRQMDRLLSALAPASLLCTLDGPYCDSTLLSVRRFLETHVPAFVEAMKSQNKLEQARQALSGLSFESGALKEASRAVEGDVEKAFRKALSSYDKDALLSFQIQFPNYKAEKISDRLSSLEADEMYHLLKSKDRMALAQFLQANPTSPYVPEVKKKLEPLLLHAALTQYDPQACQTYLSLFPPETEGWRKVNETLAWMMRPAIDSTIPPAPTPYPAPASAVAHAPEDNGEDGPRTPPPLPEGYSPLLGRELGRIGLTKENPSK